MLSFYKKIADELSYMPIDMERAIAVLSGRVNFHAGTIFIHFYTKKDMEKGSALLKELHESELTAEEFNDWQSHENSGLSIDEFKEYRRGHFRGKVYGI